MILFIKHWNDLDGRMNRRQFFLGYIAYAFWMALIWSVIAMMFTMVNPDAKLLVKTMFGSVISTVITTIFMIPVYTAIVRRLNDAKFGKGFAQRVVLVYVLLGLIPHPTAIALTIPYAIILLILCTFKTDKFRAWTMHDPYLRFPDREFKEKHKG